MKRHREAVKADEEVVQLLRQLAADNPAHYTSRLARSLQNLGAHLSSLHEYVEAVDAQQEALMLLRQLAAQDPVRYIHDLSVSLNKLGVDLGSLGRHKEAGQANEEGLILRQRQAAESAEPAATIKLRVARDKARTKVDLLS